MDGKIVPIPPSQETVNTLFNANVHTEEEMEVRQLLVFALLCVRRLHVRAALTRARWQAWLEARRVVNANPKDGEEAALSKAVRYARTLLINSYKLPNRLTPNPYCAYPGPRAV